MRGPQNSSDWYDKLPAVPVDWDFPLAGIVFLKSYFEFDLCTPRRDSDQGEIYQSRDNLFTNFLLVSLRLPGIKKVLKTSLT